MNPRVLVAEADAGRSREMTGAFSRRFDCERVASLEEAVAALTRQCWAAVVAGYDFPDGGSGLEILQVAQEIAPRAFRLFYCAYGSPGLLRDVQRLGSPHFVADAREARFVAALEQALEELLEPPSLELPPRLNSILEDVWTAHSPIAREFLRQLKVAAEQDTPVFVFGEPGTGRTRAGVILRRWRRQWKAAGSPGAADHPLPVPVIRLPSLREHPQDLPILAARCLLEYARQSGEPMRRLSTRAVEQLLAREWQGNVVELSSVLVRAIQRAGARAMIEAEDLPQDVQPPWRSSQYAKNAGQRDCLLRQLRTARNVSAAARLEGCSRANYIRLMRRLGILRADVCADDESSELEDGLLG
jgi:DNA-binding NtrC family response regulator